MKQIPSFFSKEHQILQGILSSRILLEIFKVNYKKLIITKWHVLVSVALEATHSRLYFNKIRKTTNRTRAITKGDKYPSPSSPKNLLLDKKLELSINVT